MAATAVGKWASFSNWRAQVAGDILPSGKAGVDVYLNPARRCDTAGSFTVADSMWASGADVVRGVHCDPLGSSIAGYVAATESLLRHRLSAA
uniref:Uncharacterized protein n=1 Tax=Hyaloperonospora arabidopsidis (strain Emoy2) TaxID=559515 RepID=M4BC01_HYAAE